MPRPPVAIVGAGVVGRTIGLHLRDHGYPVRWFDSERPHRATPASAGFMYLPWLTHVSPEEFHQGLELLSRFYPVYCMEGLKHPGYRIAAADILTHAGVDVDPRDVASVTPEGTLVTGDGEQYPHHHVIVCAGAWTNELIHPGVLDLRQVNWKIRPKAGTAMRYRGDFPQMVLTPWAPYKQLMVFQERDGIIWGGDGTSIIAAHYTNEHIARTDARLRGVLGDAPPLVDFLTGWRPYRPLGGPWCQQLGPRLWIATGGNKSSTLLSALWARQIHRGLSS